MSLPRLVRYVTDAEVQKEMRVHPLTLEFADKRLEDKYYFWRLSLLPGGVLPVLTSAFFWLGGMLQAVATKQYIRVILVIMIILPAFAMSYWGLTFEAWGVNTRAVCGHLCILGCLIALVFRVIVMIPGCETFANFWGEYSMHRYGPDRELSTVSNLTTVLLTSSIIQLIPALQMKTYLTSISLRYVALLIDIWSSYNMTDGARYTALTLTAFAISNLTLHYSEHTHRLKFFYSLKYEDAADKVKTMLKYTCHELRNPLLVVTAAVDVMKTKIAQDTKLQRSLGHDADFSQTLDTLTEAANYMAQLANDVLEIGKLEVGKFQLNLDQHVALDVFCAELKHFVNTIAPTIPCDFSIAANLPLVLKTDKMKLYQLCLNGILNAIRAVKNAMFEDPCVVPRLEIVMFVHGLETSCSESPTSYTSSKPASQCKVVPVAEDVGDSELQMLTVEVRDNGLGVGEAPLRTSMCTSSSSGAASAAVETPYTSFKNVTPQAAFADPRPPLPVIESMADKLTDRSNGLGLLICHELLEAIGGHLTLSNRADGIRGASFSFKFPYLELTTQEVEQMQEAVPSHTTAMPAQRLTPAVFQPMMVKRQHINVLIVDDDALNRSILSQCCKLSGCECTTAGNGEAALALVRKRGVNAFQLVITDHYMPRLTGAKLSVRLRQLGFRGTLYLLTGSADEIPRLQQEYGTALNGFLTKPCGLHDIARVIDSAVQYGGRSAPPAAAAAVGAEDLELDPDIGLARASSLVKRWRQTLLAHLQGGAKQLCLLVAVYASTTEAHCIHATCSKLSAPVVECEDLQQLSQTLTGRQHEFQTIAVLLSCSDETANLQEVVKSSAEHVRQWRQLDMSCRLAIYFKFPDPQQGLQIVRQYLPNYQQEISGVLRAPIDSESVAQALLHAVDPTQLVGEQCV